MRIALNYYFKFEIIVILDVISYVFWDKKYRKKSTKLLHNLLIYRHK